MLFNKKLKEQIRLVTSDIFEFHRWFANIKADIKILKKNDDYLAEYIAELKAPKAGQTWIIEYIGKEYLGYYTYYNGGTVFLPHKPNEFVKSYSQSDIKPLRQL